jgi:putative ABC transport system permease protein
VPKEEAAAAATIIGTPSAGRLRSTFLFVQTAVAAALLASTFVIASGLLRFHRMDLGFDPANTLLVEVPLPSGPRGARDAARAFASRVLARLDNFPGVHAAAISSPVPLVVPRGGGPAIETATAREASGPSEPPGNYVSVTPEFFRATGMRIELGRGFTLDDVSGAEQIVVLNMEAARRLFGSTDPLGQRVRFGRDADSRRWRTIVGVVANTVVQPLDPEIEPRLYVPYDQDPGRLLTVTIRTAGDPELLARPVSAALNEIDPTLAHETPVSAERQLSMALWPLRLFNGFAGGLAIFGVLVAAMGVYGLTRYLTLARTREIALCLALGAAPAAILRLVLRQSGVPVAAGIVTGLGASVAISNLLQHIVTGMAAFDPIALSAAAVSLAAAGGAALALPAVRATRIAPAESLRHE